MPAYAEWLKTTAYHLLPPSLFLAVKRTFRARKAALLRDDCRRERDIAGIVKRVLESDRFHSEQRPQEIRALLEILKSLSPRRVCEIGGRKGGTLALFAQVSAPDARILSVDIDYEPGQKEALSAFAIDRQSITCVAADSHLPETHKAVVEWLGGDKLDFLFIDGDHTFDGAMNDYRMYSPLVRSGGIIAFHDIVPDSFTRTGVRTPSYVGEVPEVWRQLRDAHGSRTRELVEDWTQDGYGIGVLYVV